MRLLQSIAPQLLLATSALVSAASWSFEDASVSISSKGGAATKEAYVYADNPHSLCSPRTTNAVALVTRPTSTTPTTSHLDANDHVPSFTPQKPLTNALPFSSSSTLKLLLTTTNSNKGRKAHQAFLRLNSPSNPSLADSFPLTTKGESGKSAVSLTFKDIPTQLLKEDIVNAEIVIGSFGSSQPYKGNAFLLKIEKDGAALPKEDEQLRYGKREEIHHIFRTDPKSPPRIITLVFAAGVLVSLPILLGAWLALGGNVNHLGKAMGAAPISHALFVGSILAMEGVFFLYYTSWNLFQTLPVAGVIGVVAFYSGSKALSEVQDRRLAGLR